MTNITVKNLSLICGLLLIGLNFVCNEWLLAYLFSEDGIIAPLNITLIRLFNVSTGLSGFILVIRRSFVVLFDVWGGLLMTVLLFYGAEKVFYGLNHRPSSPRTEVAGPTPGQTWHEGSYTDDFFIQDAWLGYRLPFSRTVTAIKKLDTGEEMRIIYDVVYTTDDQARRLTPMENIDQRDKFLLFFGDSFVFGEGVNDDQTLPFYVAQFAPHYHVYNYGFSGYGPQQMLAQLQSADLRETILEKKSVLKEGDFKAGMAVYVFIDAHVERAIGSMFVHNNWGAEMPYYRFNWRGDVIRQGNFTSGRPVIATLYTTLAKSEIATYYRLNLPLGLANRHYRFTARLIAAARDTFREKFQSDDFYILIYPDEGDYVADMIPHFEDFQLQYLNYDEMLKLDRAGYGIEGDGHPTGKAHAQVARAMVEDLGIGE